MGHFATWGSWMPEICCRPGFCLVIWREAFRLISAREENVETINPTSLLLPAKHLSQLLSSLSLNTRNPKFRIRLAFSRKAVGCLTQQHSLTIINTPPRNSARQGYYFILFHEVFGSTWKSLRPSGDSTYITGCTDRCYNFQVYSIRCVTIRFDILWTLYFISYVNNPC